MISARLVVLDIGATLVSGPARTPASRIAAELRLDHEQKRALRAALMTTPFRGPGEVARRVAGLCDAPADAILAVVSEVWSAHELEAQPIDGAAAALADLSRRGLRLALVSNIWPPYPTSARRHFGAPSRTIRSIAELGADVVALRRRGPPDAAPRPVHARSRSAS